MYRESAATWRSQSRARISDLYFLDDSSDTDIVHLNRRQLAARDGHTPLYSGASPPVRSRAYDTFTAKTDTEICYDSSCDRGYPPVRAWNDPSPISMHFRTLPTPPPLHLHQFVAASTVAPNQKVRHSPIHVLSVPMSVAFTASSVMTCPQLYPNIELPADTSRTRLRLSQQSRS